MLRFFILFKKNGNAIAEKTQTATNGCSGFSAGTECNGGKPWERNMPATVKMGLSPIIPRRFLCALSVPSPKPPSFKFFATLPCPPKFSRLGARQSTNKPPLHNSSNPKGAEFLRLARLCRNTKHLEPLMSLLIVKGLIEDESSVGEFDWSCFYVGAPDVALSAFRRIEKPSVVLQNLMVRCLCNCGLYEDVMFLYLSCRASGLPSDDFTFPFVIKACSALNALRIGKEVHCVVLRTGFEKNLVIQTALVDFYAKSGCMGTARTLIDRIPQPDMVCWNALIAGYSSNGLDEEAFVVFRQILVMGLKPNVSTFASIIPVCARLGCLDIGKCLHGFAAKSGYFSNDFLVPALISMYAGDVNLSTARSLFDSLLEKNVTVWNAMISAYTQRQNTFEAFEMFQQMIRAGLQPNLVTFVSIIPSCENSNSLWVGESLHACVIKHGSEAQLPVLTALVSMYSKLGDVNSAIFLFYQMPNRNLLLWNSMISGHVLNGQWDASLATFREMQFAGCNPDAVSIVNILSACSKLEAVFLGKSAHAVSVRKGIDSNLNVTNALLAFYSDCHQLSSSFQLFNAMAGRNAVSWNTLISGCVNIGDVEKAAVIFHLMQKEGPELDLVTLISILPIFNENKNLVQGRALHGFAMKTGFDSDVSLVNALISMYCYCGDLEGGRSLFEIMPQRSVVSWNALITGFRYHNLRHEALILFNRMIKEDQRPNYVTLLNLLPLCCNQLQGKSIHAFIVRTGVAKEIPLVSSLIFMYARFENLNSCLLLFHMGKRGDISLWNAVMSVHVQSKNAKKAVAFFCDLLQLGLQPDKITALSLISACVQLNSINLTHSVLSYLIRKGFDKYMAVCNALIDLYSRGGHILNAKKLFDGLVEKDAISFSVMINGYGLHGDAEAALDLLSQMELSGMRPGDVIYLNILSACSHSGLVEKGRTVFNSMVEQGISPKIEHYACMVDLLGRIGHLNEAYDIVKGLACKPSVSMLQSLLGGCRIHGNVELGERIGEMLFEMDPKNSRSYVMLYNIYAAAGRWTDANKVRSDMERRQLIKLPGFSLLVENELQDEALS
jgi:pentatricopeptide repeat protein